MQLLLTHQLVNYKYNINGKRVSIKYAAFFIPINPPYYFNEIYFGTESSRYLLDCMTLINVVLTISVK